MPMKRQGFTLLELILVSGIVILAGTLVVPAYRNSLIRNDLVVATGQVTQGLARARLLSQASKYDTGWGFDVPTGTLYRGDSYEHRDPLFDEHFIVPPTIDVTGIRDLTYAKFNGMPSEMGDIILTTQSNEKRTVVISIDRYTISVSSPTLP